MRGTDFVYSMEELTNVTDLPMVPTFISFFPTQIKTWKSPRLTNAAKVIDSYTVTVEPAVSG